ncbi:Condensin-2 complex subunit H2 [Entomophthora muscae]|uniref:Condensin-2 complex subunit H2 n=1 Tax=Entomophthora muscae TaxID=34485 RepID=A0ACC2TIB1_9FUNG|nr:Condensin-2 complex subunit H2 [Entomophthora muscae]
MSDFILKSQSLSERLKALQPSRDLGSNFEIDIANSLECFKDELAKMDFDPAGLAGTSEQVNFFQAALMIQNSAIIYGKKVEYLYKLVLEALNTSHGKRKRSKKGPTLPLTLDECFNSLPSDIFSGDQYIEVTSRQTIPLSLSVPSKVPLIPQIPLLFSQESASNPCIAPSPN